VPEAFTTEPQFPLPTPVVNDSTLRLAPQQSAIRQVAGAVQPLAMNLPGSSLIAAEHCEQYSSPPIPRIIVTLPCVGSSRSITESLHTTLKTVFCLMTETLHSESPPGASLFTYL
jgi:hypothetical protein